jgi:acyl-CoA thioesterase II
VERGLTRPATASGPSPSLTDVLALRQDADADRWLGTGTGPAGRRLFGGQLMAQAALAAAQSVGDGRVLTGVRADLLHGGDAATEICYAVESLQSGRTADVRRVRASQGPVVLAEVVVRFAAEQAGPERNLHFDLGPGPEGLPENGAPHRLSGLAFEHFELRHVDTTTGDAFGRDLWLRSSGPAGAGPHHAVAAIVFITDLYLLDTALRQQGRRADDRSVRWATTDHSLWVHSQISLDDWLLLRSTAPTAGGGRASVEARLLDRRGRLLATIVQGVFLENR